LIIFLLGDEGLRFYPCLLCGFS